MFIYVQIQIYHHTLQWGVLLQHQEGNKVHRIKYLFHLQTRENISTIEAKGETTYIKKKNSQEQLFLKSLIPFLHKPQKMR